MNRDKLNYIDGMNLYVAYMIPNSLDPYGYGDCPSPASSFEQVSTAIRVKEMDSGLGLAIRDNQFDTMSLGLASELSTDVISAVSGEFGIQPKTLFQNMVVDLSKSAAGGIASGLDGATANFVNKRADRLSDQ